VLRVDN